MARSQLSTVTRAFVSVLLALARAYSIAGVDANRDASTPQLQKAYRKVLLKVHPDKGGSKKDVQRLQTAKEEWDDARKKAGTKGGRPKNSVVETALVVQSVRQQRKEYRVSAALVLLTYSKIADLGHWHRFLDFVRQSLKKWGVTRWAATLEACGLAHAAELLECRGTDMPNPTQV